MRGFVLGFGLIVALACAAQVRAIDLVGHRMSNDGIRCTAACIETSARALGIESMHGFLQRAQGPGEMPRVRKQIESEGVAAILQNDGTFDRDVLRTYAESNGVVVTICKGADWIDFKGCHSVLATKYGETEVEYFDPNHRTENRKVARAEFDKYWSGNAIVLLPNPTIEELAPGIAPKPEADTAPSDAELTAGVELTDVERSMHKQLNDFRRRSGLAPLKVTANLMARARGHANWMARNNSITHSAGIQENIAAGQSSATAATTTWINSGGHNANMRTNSREVGVAMTQAANGTNYWVQQFATGSENWDKPKEPAVKATAAKEVATKEPDASQPASVQNTGTNYGRRFGRR